MSKTPNTILTDSIEDLTDIEFAFARIDALCNVLIEYIHSSNAADELSKKDNIAFSLMTIRDLTTFYEKQVQNLKIVDGKLKPLNAAVE